MVAIAHGDAEFLSEPLKQLQRLVDEAFASYGPEAPEKTAPLLAMGYKQTVALLEQVESSSLNAEDKYNLRHELEIKRVQFNQALTEALGVQLQSGGRRFDPYAATSSAGARPPLPLTPEPTQATITPGGQIDVRLHLSIASGLRSEVVLKRTALETPAGEHWTVQQLQAPDLHDAASSDALFRVTAAADAKPTAPYFSRPSTEQPYYDLSDARWRGDSFAPYPLTGTTEFEYRGVPLRTSQVVQAMHHELGLGSVYTPLMVVPRLSVTLAQQDGIVPEGSATFPVSVRVHSDGPHEGAEPGAATTGTLSLEVPPGWQATPAKAEFHLPSGEEETTDFVVHPDKLAEHSYVLKAVAESKGQRFDSGYETAGYAGIIPYPLYRPAQETVRGVDVRVAPKLNVGYVMGTGDDVPGALEQMGVHAHLLSSEELLTGDLSGYNTIVLGIRAYSARPELAAANARLLEYVHQGGTLVAQYMSAGFDGDLGPYPFHLGSNPEKVVDERAPVVLLKPDAPLLTWPNRITAADFNGWVEERGHSFMESWSPEYVPLLETHDPGQNPQRGGLLVAHYGKGTYIYAGLALYRQTPVGVPGAFRILANLVSAGSPQREQRSRK
jgi:hypothetical protein